MQMDSIRSLLNMKIYVDTDDDVRLARRLTRDIESRGRSIASESWCWLLPHQMIFPPWVTVKQHGNGSGTKGGSSINMLAVLIQFKHVTNMHTPCTLRSSLCHVYLTGILEQYTRFVKPAFDQFIAPSRRHADVIIPWR
jgi:hypothetical protein